jgi:arylsulfatase A-like enzyme
LSNGGCSRGTEIALSLGASSLRRRAATAAALLAAVAALAGCGHATPSAEVRGEHPRQHSSSTSRDVPADRALGYRPNIVFVLMDDFSLELLATMPNALRMQSEGATYDNAFVVDSLCCPSRASIFTGQAPHQTGVLTNTPNDYGSPIGGFEAFAANGNLKRAFNVSLQHSGYTTGFVGKYMNHYEPVDVGGGVLVPPPRLPGWSDFQAILGGGYNGWNFETTRIDRDGHLQMVSHDLPARDDPRIDDQYATNVAADKAIAFIAKHAGDRRPYFLEVAVYGPHAQLAPAYPGQHMFPAAMADRPSRLHPGGNCGAKACADLRLKDLKGYGDPREDNQPTYLRADGSTAPAPAWRTNEITLTDAKALRQYQDRARMVQSIDRMVTRIRQAIGPDTYLVLTADNGFHLGQHQLNGGKGAPYDSDTRVPLIVTGPGVVPGERTQFVNNIDLAPTFEELAGLEPAPFRSGISFAETLATPGAATARYAFFEHTYAKSAPGEVDLDTGSGGTIDIIPSYVAVRGARGLLVRLDLDPSWQGTDYAWELYRYDRPWEDVNVFAEDHDKPWAQDLMARLKRWVDCTPAECRDAAR